ncbi:uncharacterized protein LOC108905633 isoform X2 [Anoplophora glabripennis]|uniref:uncharacterized protein LOC108905633 isoform X2 n=1 Tax=Anoplophora glabripennis TaxID=217634 RepID=UPI000874C308|nr:uncharacterized protein LOC108905633 isoform X2 [Anoplophora glabripennis]
MEVSENMEEKCRLCDEVGEKMFSIFDKNEEGHQFLQLIKECLPIIIYRTDPLSKQICERCCMQLESVAKFKKISQDTAERHKEKLRSNSGEESTDIRLFLGCDYDMMEGSELKDASTSTEDLIIYCNNCKQSILDPNAVNEKLLRRRKVVPFYHELDDSLCSSLTEFTQNTEGSQCFEMPSDDDEESVDSDETQRPAKRRRIFEDESEEKEGGGLLMIRKPADINGETNLEDLYADEDEYRYQPLSLLQLALNVINKENVPDYEPFDFTKELVYPKCNYCAATFQNLKLLAIHETVHMDVEMGEKIDNPVPWHHSRENAEIRNKWLSYFDENGYEDDDIIIDVVTNDLLIPMDMKEERTGLTGEEQIVLVGTQPMVNGIYLGDYTKEERKSFYQSMRIQGVNKKFCHLCRYCFKDNWAIESHYFSSACYYTCRYCGMRFNKQRHRYNEHVEEHKTQNHDISDKIFAASKLSNVVPKVINPQKARKVVVGDQNPPQPIQIQPQQPSPPAQYSTPGGQPIRVKNLMERRTLQPNLQIKEEPQEPKDIITSQSKTGNQAYFCRKCYKVFFKLDEFNVHSKNCDYNQFPQLRNMAKPAYHSKNGEVPTSPAGRPIRNCAKEIGPYKDEAYLPDSILKDPKPNTPQSFVCFICNTPFPTIYSRNSHMRIHKGETQAMPSTSQKPRSQMQNSYQNYRTPPPQTHQVLIAEGMIKQEPMDMPMEPMVEIHEPEQNYTGSIGDGAVSITPISKNPRQKPTINPNIMRIVQNNPQLSIKKSPEKYPMPGSSNNHVHMGVAPPDLDKSYKCSSCWEAFANKSHLYFHKKNQCEGSRFPCPFCKKRFGTEAAYSSHIFYSHPE